MGNPDIKILFKNIDILSKNMIPLPVNDFGGDAFEFDIHVDSKVNAPNKLILVVTTINIRELNKELVLSSISVGCAFEIENFSEVIILRDGKYTIPPYADTLIKAMSVSTVRGIIFSEFRGTYLHNAVLPIVLFPQANDEELLEMEKAGK